MIKLPIDLLALLPALIHRSAWRSTLANFSHLGVRQRASVKGSTNACETFCGSVQAETTRKKYPLFPRVAPAYEEEESKLCSRGVA